MTRVAVVGSRDLDEGVVFDVHETLSALEEARGELTIVSGGANGPDTWAEEWANDRETGLLVFLPDWKTCGKAAGIIRNGKIIENCDILIAFWDGQSKGTKNSIDRALSAGKETHVYIFKETDDG